MKTWFEKGFSHSTIVAPVVKGDVVKRLIEEEDFVLDLFRHVYAVCKLRTTLLDLIEYELFTTIPVVDVILNVGKSVGNFPELIATIVKYIVEHDEDYEGREWEVRSSIYKIIDTYYSKYFNLRDVHDEEVCRDSDIYMCLHRSDSEEDLEECLDVDECSDCDVMTIQCRKPIDMKSFWKYVAEEFEKHLKQVGIDIKFNVVQITY